MRREDMDLMYEYNYWASARILNAASMATPTQLDAPAAFPWHSLRGTLVHILDAEFGWRTLFESPSGGWNAQELNEADFPTFESISVRAGEEQAAMRAYLGRLTDEDLPGIVRYTTDAGEPRERVLWHCLYHVVNHGTQHRSEAAAILTELGHSPGDLDFTVFLNDRRKATK